MDCENFHKKLAMFENLSDEEKAELKAHAGSCAECSKEYEAYNNMLETVRSLPKLSAPDDFLAKLNERIDAEKPARVKPPGVWTHLRQHSYRYGAVAACLMLVAVIGINSGDLIGRMNGTDSELPVLPPAVGTEKLTDGEEASPKPTEEAKSTQQPAASAAPKVSATHKPLATAIPTSKPKATSRPSSPTLSPKASVSTPVYEPQNDTAQDDTRVFSENNTTAAPKDTEPAAETPDNSGIAVAEAPENTGNSVPDDPSEYSLPDDEPTVMSVNPAAPGDYTRGTEVSNSIQVSAANEARAREIISSYSIASDGDCYSVSSDRMEEFLEAMSNAEIDYSQNCIDDGSGTVTFRLIIS
ncbi:MAG TPA: hypothetical protein IAA60_04595 [Candidatus Ornithomonoglobus intestinigallinarum]|uniref:Zinc-finger domain-containing protein n=1 Tax=Candidatus Ornithomonoglobus intestinigallinarum TaxID=2840894 RepID=A0A9D1KQL9_9FIRM|nr:hypothetical protein [Candidatus Ornithomonoglobus intestinigallinarum]